MGTKTIETCDLRDRIAEHLVSQEAGDVSRALLIAALEEIERLGDALNEMCGHATFMLATRREHWIDADYKSLGVALRKARAVLGQETEEDE